MLSFAFNREAAGRWIGITGGAKAILLAVNILVPSVE
jgi:hypothetical protein